MSYMALYRKFRPDNFNDVKGQEPIITTLKNQIISNRIGHAYLFCGTRGTGKTTAAKILGKAVNCERPEEGNPCNSCEMCLGIMEETSLNVIEIDAASNNGVDNIREIVDEVRYSPTEGRYKVYIIDEVHMLSTGAFNALLKTLEEPPSYVIFILATTEVHKIPITILSRCQRFDFKRITVDVIIDRLAELTKIEKIDIEEKALRYIATAADGALRDALSLLDQCVSFYLGEFLTYDKVLEVLGAVDTTVFSNLIKKIIEEDINGCLKLIDEIEVQGRELGQFTVDFIWYQRNLLIVQMSNDVSDILEMSTENLERLKEDSKLIDGETLIRYIRVFSELSNQIRYANRKKILLEVTLIKLCRPQMEENYDSLVDRIRQLEDKLEKGVVLKESPRNTEALDDKSDTPREIKNKEAPPVLAEALPEDIKVIAKNWSKIQSRITKKSFSVGDTLKSTIPSIGPNNELQIIAHEDFAFSLINKENNLNLIKETIEEVINKKIEISCKYREKESAGNRREVDLTEIIKMPIKYED